jgi:16S rRNA (cytosine1402-N4)-methyltransferase
MSFSPSQHEPVMLDEIVHWLAPLPGQILADGTLGGGGHTRALAQRVGRDGLVVALDRDPAAIAAAERGLQGFSVVLAESDFCDLPEVLRELNVAAVDGVVLDLGLSSDQLADEARGFSFDSPGPLDLRFNPNRGEPAARLVNHLREDNLANLIYQYGEERYSRRIAKAIAAARREKPIEASAQLARIVRRAVPRSQHERIDPATRTFQALRIAVNDELKSLELALRRIPTCLRPDGRLAVISFHSLEDRLVKEAFRNDPRWEPLTRKPIRPSAAEVARNPRSRSAKLRVAAAVPAVEPR